MDIKKKKLEIFGWAKSQTFLEGIDLSEACIFKEIFVEATTELSIYFQTLDLTSIL